MAYQPIQMPQFSGAALLGDAFRTIGEANRRKQQDQAEAFRTGELMRRQKQTDQERVLGQAQALAAKGDKKGAVALLTLHGMSPGTMQREAPEEREWGPKLNRSELDFADQVGQDFAPMTPQQPGGGVAPSKPMEGLSDPNAIGEQAAGEDWQQTQPQHPLMAMVAKDKAATKAKNKRMYETITGRFADGQQFEIDSDASRFAQQRQADDAFYEASGEETPMGDIVREQYPAIRAAGMAAGRPVDADDTLRNLQGEARLRAQEAAADARARMAIEAEDRRQSEWDRRNAITSAQSDARMRMIARLRSESKPPTEGDLKAEGQSQRMLEAFDSMKRLPPLDANDRDTILKHLGEEDYLEKNPGQRMVGQWLGRKTLPEKLSEGGNGYWTQIQEIGAAILRKESGAAISAEEWRNIFQRYAPVRGDSDAVVAQKEQNMLQAIKALANESRRGGAPIKAEVDKRLGKGKQAPPAGNTHEARAAARMKALEEAP